MKRDRDTSQERNTNRYCRRGQANTTTRTGNPWHTPQKPNNNKTENAASLFFGFSHPVTDARANERLQGHFRESASARSEARRGAGGAVGSALDPGGGRDRGSRGPRRRRRWKRRCERVAALCGRLSGFGGGGGRLACLADDADDADCDDAAAARVACASRGRGLAGGRFLSRPRPRFLESARASRV